MRGKNLVQMDFEKKMKDEGHTVTWNAKGPWDFICDDKKYIVKRELYGKIFIPHDVMKALPADTIVAVKGSSWYFTDLKDKKITVQYHKKILRISVDDDVLSSFKAFASSYPDSEQALIELMRRAGIYRKPVFYRLRKKENRYQ